jgi:hypothetical protein
MSTRSLGVCVQAPIDVVASHGVSQVAVRTGIANDLQMPSLTVQKRHGPGDKLDHSRCIGWAACKDALKLLGEASDAFEPLKLAVGGLLGILDRIEVRVLI